MNHQGPSPIEVMKRMWVKQARSPGATNDEIAEAIMTSRMMKAATVNDTAAAALAWLHEQKE